MESANKFDLKEAVDDWLQANCPADAFLPADVDEMRDQFWCIIEELQEEQNLEGKQAFEIASQRMGDNYEFAGQMKQANQDNFQLKKVVLLFGGAIFYIFSYHFILCVNRLLLMLQKYVLGTEMEIAVGNVSTFFNLVYLISVSGLVAIYFWHKPVKWLFSKIMASTIINVFIVIGTLLVVVLELYLVPKAEIVFGNLNYRTFFFSQETIFRYVYFVIMIVGYIVLFVKYLKKYNR